MKGIKKIGVFFVCLVLLAAGGYLYFDRNVLNATSDMDSKTKEEQKSELLTKEEFSDLPEVQALKEQEKELKKGGALDTKAGQGVPSSGNKNTTQVTTDNSKKADIENRLKQKLSSLQGEYSANISGLVASAKDEYNQIASGQKTGSKSALAQKYLGLAQGMEAQCDARVYAAIAYAENELQEYGYQSSVPEQVRQAYQQQKKERRQQLLSKL